MTIIIHSAMNNRTSPKNHLFKSAGAPIGSTGAPMEGTCGELGCHYSDQGVNSGPGMVSLSLASGDTAYQPNGVYQVDISLNQAGIDKLGFQALVLRDQDSSNIGQVFLTDAIRSQELQVQDSISVFYGRNYITHTVDGNVAQPIGWGQWSFEWTAPPAGSGDLTIYLATVAANNNGNAVGDDVYVNSLKLNEDTIPLLSIGEKNDNSSIKIGPSPFTQHLNVEVLNPDPDTHYLLEIVDIKGVIVLKQPFNKMMTISRDNLKGGIYFVKIKEKDSLIKIRKIIAN